MPADFLPPAIAPHAPLVPTAKSVLAARLAAVLDRLDQPKRALDEPETVHQLRVATRRGSAALRLFAPLLPRRRRRRVQKVLRKVRRAAGAVRDCDVHLAQASGRRKDPPTALVRRLQHQRQQALQTLRKLRQRQRRRLKRQVRELADKLAWRLPAPPPPYAEWCLARCDLVARHFFTLARQPAADDDALHQLRIAGKRLRYALELVAPAVTGPAVNKLLAALHELQDRLGRLCDRRAAVLQATELEHSAADPAVRRAFAAERKVQERQLAAQRRALARWWTPQRRAQWEQLWQEVCRGAHRSARPPGRRSTRRRR